MNKTLLSSSIYPNRLHIIHLSSFLVGRKVCKLEVIEELRTDLFVPIQKHTP